MATAAVQPKPRLRSTSNGSIKERSTFETLHHMMGFSKTRAEKAIAATGNKGVHAASEWLLNHVNDPTLDTVEPREYIIYLCPGGTLLDQLEELWEDSFQVCGWNSAHIYHPHVTLGSYFKMADDKVDVIDSVIRTMSAEIAEWPELGPIGLDLFTQNNNFIGFFLQNPHHQYFEELIIRTQQEFLKHGVDMKATLKQLHMTLAFQYEADQHSSLMKLAQKIDLSCKVSWEIRIYSREPLLKSSEVRKIIKAYKAEQVDELQLEVGDFIIMEPEEHTRSPDGWFRGTSWLTGRTAFFPGNFTLKCSQMDIWTLHRSVPLNFNPKSVVNGTDTVSPHSTASHDLYDNIWSSSVKKQLNKSQGGPQQIQVGDDVYASISKQRKARMSQRARLVPRRLMVFRHGERCDFAFPKTWFERSFDSKGEYKRFNLNCPEVLLPRKSFKDYKSDCPLTEMGLVQANITGMESRYCMRIEPCLFEWCGWTRHQLPSFMSMEELVAWGFPVDLNYQPFKKCEKLNLAESVEEYYTRSYEVTKHILDKHEADGGNVMIVAHSGSLDACTRQLKGKPPFKSYEEMISKVRACPYCAMCLSVEDCASGHWRICQPSLPSFMHGANKEYNWKIMLD